MASVLHSLASKPTITPEYIVSKLFSYRNIAHALHLSTPSYEEHKALDFLYSELNGFEDDIPEKLMGYVGKRVGRISIDAIPAYSEGAVRKLVDDVLKFAYDVYEWAEEQHYCDIENKAQELSGVAAKTRYFLSLK